jgi:type IV secretion system protein VirB10
LVLLLAGLLGAVMLAVAFAFQPAPLASKGRPEASGAPAPPVVPEGIRNAPVKAARTAHGVPEAGAIVQEGPRGAGTTEDTARRADQEQKLKARGSPILFETGHGPSDGERPAPMPTSGSAMASSSNGPSGAAAGSDPNLQERKNAFLAGVGAKTTDVLMATLQHPRSPTELQAGAILPTVLITGISSDLPGPVIGQVRENVYDSVSGNTLLIPQGSRLLAQYDSMVSWGQERVLLCWNRLVFPNGDSIDLQCMPASDLEGKAGLTDQVDEHWFRLLRGATIATLLAATSAGLAGNTASFSPTLEQTAARNAAGEINGVGQRVTARDLSIQPTITVRPGYAVNVIVTKDIVLPPYPEVPSALGGRP